MRINLIGVLSLLSVACHGYVTTPLARRKSIGFLKSTASSSTTGNDDAFSAFADSLEEEPSNSSSSSSSSSTTTFDGAASSWQAKLEELLDPKTNFADRQVLLSDLLSSNDEISQSVMDALAKKQIDPLLTPTGKKLQDGTRAVARQLTNDILPTLARAPSAGLENGPPSFNTFEKVGNRIFNAITNQVQKNIENLQQDLSDPINRIPQRISQQQRDFVKEARNIFLETPEGLQEPPYKVVETTDLYEIRDYEGYMAAATTMSSSSSNGSSSSSSGTSGSSSNPDDIAATGAAFNTLAAYLFGANEQKKSMSMTTPVTTTSIGEMRFYLAEQPSDIPDPLEANDESTTMYYESGSVQITEVPPARLAVRKFTGFVTEGEIARQKETLLNALDIDGVALDVAHGAVVPHVIFQYNPPYTLPIVRRNEIAVPVQTMPVTAVDLKQEWSVDESDDDNDTVSPEDDGTPSD